MMASWRSNGARHDTVVIVWIIALFAITALGAAPLWFYRLDLSKLTFSTPVPVVAGVGIEITAYAPTLAAILAVAVVPGGGGVGRLLRPIGKWRSGIHWYILALLGPSLLFLIGDVVRLALGLPLPPSLACHSGRGGACVPYRGLDRGVIRRRGGLARAWPATTAGPAWGFLGGRRGRRGLEHLAPVASRSSRRAQQHDMV